MLAMHTSRRPGDGPRSALPSPPDSMLLVVALFFRGCDMGTCWALICPHPVHEVGPLYWRPSCVLWSTSDLRCHLLLCLRRASVFDKFSCGRRLPPSFTMSSMFPPCSLGRCSRQGPCLWHCPSVCVPKFRCSQLALPLPTLPNPGLMRTVLGVYSPSVWRRAGRPHACLRGQRFAFRNGPTMVARFDRYILGF